MPIIFLLVFKQKVIKSAFEKQRWKQTKLSSEIITEEEIIEIVFSIVPYHRQLTLVSSIHFSQKVVKK